ncbi:FkbM family methyltransferase [Terasakiella sp.]|uniref:FkbM family methyltransferase n=1 Tax=Terasakiella sp. TaxID=2034861 RepID=UPI003AA7B4A4
MKQLIVRCLELVAPSLLEKIRLGRFEKILPANFMEQVKTLPEGSVCIDIGANIGLVSSVMSRYATKVIAFEPNQEALKELKRRAAKNPNIEVHNCAAGTTNKEVNLYLHENVEYTQASSLVASKPNVSEGHYQVVQEIDFAEFLTKLNCNISLIKIDIEGYEIELINHLLDHADLSKVGRIYVETHERKWPKLAVPTQQMKDRASAMGLGDKFDFDWV